MNLLINFGKITKKTVLMMKMVFFYKWIILCPIVKCMVIELKSVWINCVFGFFFRNLQAVLTVLIFDMFTPVLTPSLFEKNLSIIIIV
jgi:hypothetical protein